MTVYDKSGMQICVGGMIRTPNGWVAVRHINEHKGSFAKGHLEEYDETLEDGARREIWEETGLKQLVMIRELKEIVRKSGFYPFDEKVIKMFLFYTEETELNSNEEEVIAEAMTLKEMIEFLRHEKDIEFLIDFMAMEGEETQDLSEEVKIVREQIDLDNSNLAFH